MFSKIKFVVAIIYRNIKWLLIKLFHPSNEYVKNINGYKMYISTAKKGLDVYEASIFKQLAMDGVREFEATKVIKQLIKPGFKIFELGANVGYYALMESKIIGETGKVYAVEPEKNNINLLKRNIKLNNANNIEVNHMAISDKDGEYPLYVTSSSNLHSMGKPKTRDYKTEMVQTKSVDNFLKNKGNIDMIRMDIEGYEYEALKGMNETLKNNPNLHLFIELHTHIIEPEKSKEMLQKLKDNGFEIMVAITHDNHFRSILKETTVERITIDDLMKDERLLKQKCAFEIFFEKVGISN
ncbi:MAG: FkbM family methyltransferase [bacterium]